MTSKDSSDAEKSLKGFIAVGDMDDTDSEDGLGNTGDARSTPWLSCSAALRYFFFSIRYFSPWKLKLQWNDILHNISCYISNTKIPNINYEYHCTRIKYIFTPSVRIVATVFTNSLNWFRASAENNITKIITTWIWINFLGKMNLKALNHSMLQDLVHIFPLPFLCTYVCVCVCVCVCVQEKKYKSLA